MKEICHFNMIERTEWSRLVLPDFQSECRYYNLGWLVWFSQYFGNFEQINISSHYIKKIVCLIFSDQILKVCFVSDHHCRVFFSQQTSAAVIKNLIQSQLGLKASDFYNDRQIEKLKDYEPIKNHLRISNCFDMSDSEAIGYFKQASLFQHIDKVRNK